MVYFYYKIFSFGERGCLLGSSQVLKVLDRGDPLSPYLFILGMEILSIILRRAVAGGFISECTLTSREGSICSISHLLFAYDT